MTTISDRFGRRIHYVRLSVTDHCNYRCFYCMPDDRQDYDPQSEYLSVDEIERSIRAFSELGVHNVRITGGEPLIRKDLLEIAQRIGVLPGIDDLSLSTNAHLLAPLAEDLVRAGVQRVNISLDSLNPDRFREITRGHELQPVLDGIDAALSAGMSPVKINMVIMKGVNDDEIDAMVDYSLERKVNLRFIETMPIDDPGVASMRHHYPAQRILDHLRDRFQSELSPGKMQRGAGPARYYSLGDGGMTVGVISAVSRHFCDTCNRVRLGSKGELLLCLGQDDRVDLRALMRGGADDDAIKSAIVDAILHKPWGHKFDEGAVAKGVSMSGIGG